MMAEVEKKKIYDGASECYGCTNMTMNLSGMCDDCVPEMEQKGKMKREVYFEVAGYLLPSGRFE
tara:strand:- start:26 stop:217 length:192 start_codon:yes stop_codon:yes gene_type:complete